MEPRRITEITLKMGDFIIFDHYKQKRRRQCQIVPLRVKEGDGTLFHTEVSLLDHFVLFKVSGHILKHNFARLKHVTTVSYRERHKGILFY